MNRRDMIKAAPVAVCAAAVSTAAFSAETPITAAYREWAAFSHWLNKVASDDEFDEQVNRRSDMEETLFAMPSTSGLPS